MNSIAGIVRYLIILWDILTQVRRSRGRFSVNDLKLCQLGCAKMLVDWMMGFFSSSESSVGDWGL